MPRKLATTNPKGKGAWYMTYITACALCGKQTVERERHYDKRPTNPAKRVEYVETACQGHFL